jgi:hypothetical protein
MEEVEGRGRREKLVPMATRMQAALFVRSAEGSSPIDEGVILVPPIKGGRRSREGRKKGGRWREGREEGGRREGEEGGREEEGRTYR